MVRVEKGRPHLETGAVVDAIFLLNGPAFVFVLWGEIVVRVEEDHVMLGEIVRVLRPKGRLMISMNNLLSSFAVPS